nr:DUF2236 domain-containing protein [Pseudopedobacter sp.]
MKLDLNTYRNIGDQKADKFVNNYFEFDTKKKLLYESLALLKSNSDWPHFLKSIPEAKWFDKEIVNIPLPDERSRAKAIHFFQSKEIYILQLLGLLSLPYCYAAADGAEVLYQTERMYKDVKTRLEETAGFVKAIMQLNTMDLQGEGKVQLFKVRVMHAAARYYLQKANWNPALGLPVNQEDMVGTTLSFSLIVIRGLRKMGFTISYEEQMSYIKYWSWVGAMLGVKAEILPANGKEAHDLDRTIAKRQFKTSEAGKKLTLSLLNCFYQLNDQSEISNKEIVGFMRFLLGDKIAEILDLPPSDFPFSKQVLLKLKITFS